MPVIIEIAKCKQKIQKYELITSSMILQLQTRNDNFIV